MQICTVLSGFCCTQCEIRMSADRIWFLFSLNIFRCGFLIKRKKWMEIKGTVCINQINILQFLLTLKRGKYVYG